MQAARSSGDSAQVPQVVRHTRDRVPLDPTYEPTANKKRHPNEKIFSELQKCRACRLVEPIDQEHMYYAAMKSTGCRLTALGKHYWRLAKAKRI